MINHDIAKLRLHKEFEMEFYYGIVVSQDDKLMAAYVDQNIIFWDINQNWSTRQYQETEDDKEQRISTIQFSQDSSKIAVGLYSSKLKIRDARTYQLLKTFTLDPHVQLTGDIKKIFFEGDIVKIGTNACYTQQFSMTSDEDPYKKMRSSLLYTHYYTDLIFEKKFSRVLVNDTLKCKRENGQIIHKSLFKQNHRGITAIKNQIYCLDSDKLYIIYRKGRIIRKTVQQQGVYRYATSKRFIACLKAKLLNLYDLFTGAMVSFKHEQLMSVIGLNSKYIIVGDWPMRIYYLPDDLRVSFPEELQQPKEVGIHKLLFKNPYN